MYCAYASHHGDPASALIKRFATVLSQGRDISQLLLHSQNSDRMGFTTLDNSLHEANDHVLL